MARFANAFGPDQPAATYVAPAFPRSVDDKALAALMVRTLATRR